MDRIEECGITEMPAMPASLPAQEMDRGNPVTVNVSMNASGKEHVADLLDMMKNAGLSGAEPVSAKILSPRMDMERLSSIMNGPMEEPEMEEIDDEIEVEGDYANEPDVQYGDMSDAIPDGNDLNRKKKSYVATQDGDNPMQYKMEVESIKKALYAALTEKKAKPDFLDVDKDGDTKEPMKKALKDKEKKTTEGRGKGRGKTKEDIQTAEGRGKVMAGRGRGKDKLMAGRGRGKK